MIIQKSRLQGVDSALVRVVEEAAILCDFMVLEGLRTQVRQAALVEAGASKTMRSAHLTGKAVDLGAIVGNEVRWDWPLYFGLAKNVQISAKKLAINIVWGGCWSSLLQDYEPEKLQEIYIDRCRTANKKPFLDGPHFEIREGVTSV